MLQVINISGYKFVPLENLSALKDTLKTHCLQLQLKGTILLSPEGINVALSGSRTSIDSFKEFLFALPQIKGSFELKESASQAHPFNRMLVRIKKEIIAFGVPGISPETYTSPHISAQTLRDWIRTQKDFVFLDTRNEYEVKLGTFKNAINPHIESFRDFPKAVKELDPQLKNKPIVTFCTGGVRCEKAAPYLEKEGFKEVYQIHGGILKYFEETDGEGWEGECFVFDHRVCVGKDLEQTNKKLCFRCRAPLTEEDCLHEDYKIDVSCPHCAQRAQSSDQLSLDTRSS